MRRSAELQIPVYCSYEFIRDASGCSRGGTNSELWVSVNICTPCEKIEVGYFRQTHHANCKIFICLLRSKIRLDILGMRESSSSTPTHTPWVWVVLAALDGALRVVWVDAVNAGGRPQRQLGGAETLVNMRRGAWGGV